MREALAVGLPNGKVCYLTSEAMRTIAKHMRWETFKRAQYLRPGFELQPEDTVIDIGANIGIFALWAGPQIPRGRLVSVEPNPVALECLRLNVRRNNLSNVTVVAAAAGGENGTMELTCPPGWEVLAHSVAVDPPWFYANTRLARFGRWLLKSAMRHTHDATLSRMIAAQQMTLSRIMDEHDLATVNFLKMDCEGSEYEVLRSLDPEHWARIERVVMEYHDFGDRNHRELVEILRNNGFEVRVARTLLGAMFALAGARFGTIWAKKRAPS